MKQLKKNENLSYIFPLTVARKLPWVCKKRPSSAFEEVKQRAVEWVKNCWLDDDIVIFEDLADFLSRLLEPRNLYSGRRRSLRILRRWIWRLSTGRFPGRVITIWRSIVFSLPFLPLDKLSFYKSIVYFSGKIVAILRLDIWRFECLKIILDAKNNNVPSICR